MVPDWVLYWAAAASTISIILVLVEWTMIWFKGVKPMLAWTTGAGTSIVGEVLRALKGLRTGRGKNPTAVEQFDEVGGEGGSGPPPKGGPAPLALPGIPQIAGIDPRAMMEGKPILDKFMAGQKLTQEETAKGLQLLGYFANAAKGWGGPNGGANGGGGPGGASPASSGWD